MVKTIFYDQGRIEQSPSFCFYLFIWRLYIQSHHNTSMFLQSIILFYLIFYQHILAWVVRIIRFRASLFFSVFYKGQRVHQQYSIVVFDKKNYIKEFLTNLLLVLYSLIVVCFTRIIYLICTHTFFGNLEFAPPFLSSSWEIVKTIAIIIMASPRCVNYFLSF